MILQSLVQYYEEMEKQGKITSPGWCMAKVSYALDLSEDGELLRVIPLKLHEMRGKKQVEVSQILKVPEMVTRSSGENSNFLCDNSGYFLGIDNKGKPERAVSCFGCAKEKHLKILENTESESSGAVIRFFENWDPGKAAEHPALQADFEDIIAGGNIIFSVNSVYAHDDEQIKEAWEVYRTVSENEVKGNCLVTGKRDTIARTHATIKGVPGAQTSGAALVSFNAPAFESYGKEQSYNAPVGAYAAYAYTTALNQLISDRAHTSSVGDTQVVYWAESGEQIYQQAFMAVTEPMQDNQEIVRGVFENLEKGKGIAAEDVEKSLSMDQRFYILGLAPNAARLAVRFFYHDSFGNILKNIKKHYEQMEIVRPSRDSFEYLGTYRLLQETVNKKSRDKKPIPNMGSAVYRAVISGSRYPASLYQAVLCRLRAEQDDKDSHTYKITRGRAAIIKAYLLRNTNIDKEELTVGLNEENKNIAYTLGRMFSVLEAIQEDANPGINATIKDRFFNSACATPAAIFPILFKLKNSHIRKMQGKGAQVYYEKLLGRLQDNISLTDEQMLPYPKRLSLEEQGMFILGYYHQTQKRFEKKVKEEAENE